MPTERAEISAAGRVRLESSWRERLAAEFDAPYMAELRAFLAAQKRAGKTIFPPGKQIFAALDATAFDDVKVVIIGQDPYHGPGQAHGLCFSVRPGVKPPPSLINIFREINDDMNDSDVPGGDPHGYLDGSRGCLDGWAQQGVLLLNAVLTVEQGRAGSHHGRGWERFTDAVVAALNDQRENLVFLLWGSNAQKKGSIVDRDRHFVLTARHPSPLSAHSGFFGCAHFSSANRYLEAHGKTPINWFDVR